MNVKGTRVWMEYVSTIREAIGVNVPEDSNFNQMAKLALVGIL